MTQIAKDGTIITQTGNFVTCSNGKTYTLMGKISAGPNGAVSMNVRDISEAVSIIVGLHGGKRL